MIIDFEEFKSIKTLLRKFPTENKCIEHLEALRWNGVIISPFNKESKVYRCSNHRFKCSKTNKYFNVRNGTIFENTKMSLQKWFMAIYLVLSPKKLSSHQLAKDLNVSQKTGWLVLNRIRYAVSHKNFKKAMK